MLPVTLVSSLAAFALGQVFWRGHGRPAVGLTDPGVAQVVLGAAVANAGVLPPGDVPGRATVTGYLRDPLTGLASGTEFTTT